MKTMAKTRKGQSRRRRGAAWRLGAGRRADRIMLKGDCPDIGLSSPLWDDPEEAGLELIRGRNRPCDGTMLHQMIKRQSIQSGELRPSRGIAKIGRKGLFRQGRRI
jgi:hypothetical protein